MNSGDFSKAGVALDTLQQGLGHLGHCGESVASSPLGMDIARVVRVVIQFAPQPLHEDFQIVYVVDIFWTPHTFEELMVR